MKFRRVSCCNAVWAMLFTKKTRRVPPPRHRPPAKELAVLYGESQTSQFVEAVRKLKEEQRKIERRTRQAKQKVKQHLRKAGRAG